MAEQHWTPSTVMLGRLQKLTKQGFMTAVELATYRVLENPVFPAPMDGYVLSFGAFYERGFSMPLPRFVRSLLQYYGLELHSLTPSGILRIAAFMSLCEAYLGIDPEFDLWNYFFRVRCPQDPDTELIVSRGTVIHVKFEHGVDPYFNILMPRSINWWRKKWIYLRNDTSALLHTFTSSHLIPLPS
jgi:hypothetical protein